MIAYKSDAEVKKLREAGRLVANALHAVREAAAPGVTLRRLDEIAEGIITNAGATPAFKGYLPHFSATPFPGTVCASVNDAIVHGIPDGTELVEGDLLSIDCGAHLNGWTGDAAFSMIIGGDDKGSPEDRKLIETTREALRVGIEAARPGNRMGDIAAAIEDVIRGGGYGMPQGWGGHGIGREMHEDPSVPNGALPAGKGMKLKKGLVICIEPMLHIGGDDHVIDPDGWTVRTADHTRAAHEEHMVAITADGPQVLSHR